MPPPIGIGEPTVPSILDRVSPALGPPSRKKKTPFWRKVLWSAVINLSLWLAVEVVGRTYLVWGGLPWNSTLATYQNDDVLGYRPNPLFALGDIRFNSMGFRANQEYEPYPGSDTVRILAVGGSTTFGNGGETKDAYPARLEEVLRDAGRQFEVINAGVSGWQVFQIRRSLGRWIESVHPNIILFNEGWNTGARPYKYYRNEDLVTYPLFQYSLLFRFVDRRLRKVGWSLHYHPFLETREQVRQQQERINSDPEIFADFEREIRACVEICRGAEITPVFLIPPGNLPDSLSSQAENYFKGSAFDTKAPDYPAMCLAVNHTRDLSAEKILAVQRDAGFLVIDARPALDGVTSQERQELFYDELHLTPAGNRRLAAYVGSRLPAAFDTLYRSRPRGQEAPTP